MQWEMTKDTTMAPERSPLELLRESRSSIEEIISRMLSIKKQGDPKSENRELVTQMFLNFINLRQLCLCPSATARLATDEKLCASEIYGVADNVNGAAARFVNSSFNRSNLFGLLGGYMYYSHGYR
ncbi:hypothetical protein F2Q70_00042401 [Brassica cretica]|uniref:Uncharacterized protein n=1 Tax=Brassica cretica TaxID=69181 RepID=A0A8S9KNW5_BRACR|nr:hypothetical protein F2Q70_00042401 [Brassica cretica]